VAQGPEDQGGSRGKAADALLSFRHAASLFRKEALAILQAP